MDGSDRHGETGSVSLEFGLAVPVLFLLLLVVFHAAVLGRDALLVQHAARHGARTAATTADAGAVRAAVRDAMDGRPVQVSISPGRWSEGGVVHVTVVYTSRSGLGGTELTGSAATSVEPGVGGR